MYQLRLQTEIQLVNRKIHNQQVVDVSYGSQDDGIVEMEDRSLWRINKFTHENFKALAEHRPRCMPPEAGQLFDSTCHRVSPEWRLSFDDAVKHGFIECLTDGKYHDTCDTLTSMFDVDDDWLVETRFKMTHVEFDLYLINDVPAFLFGKTFYQNRPLLEVEFDDGEKRQFTDRIDRHYEGGPGNKVNYLDSDWYFRTGSKVRLVTS